MKLIIISHRYSPGLKKEFFLLGEEFKKKGFEIYYSLSIRYKDLLTISEKESNHIQYVDLNYFNVFIWIRYFKDLLSTVLNTNNRKGMVLVYNISFYDMILFKIKYYNSDKYQTLLFLHEPFKTDKKKYQFINRQKIRCRELVQKYCLKNTDVVILPSHYAKELFNEHYFNFNGHQIYAPILLKDTTKNKRRNNRKRKYFSYIGHVNQATGFDIFIQLINYAILNNQDFQFCIITASHIDKYLKKYNLCEAKNINMINKGLISDEEIDLIVSESFAVLRLDEDIVQSGVVPVCYMNSTPVICSNIAGLTQDVIHKYNGYVVGDISNMSDIIEGMHYLRDNIDVVSFNARKSYHAKWHQKNFNKYYKFQTFFQKSEIINEN